MEQEAPVARVVARISPVLKDDSQRPLGMLGFFEAEDRPEEVGQLLRHAIRWLQNQGVTTIVGPLDGDTWHRYRFNVGPFEEPPFLMEPYNPPYYAGLWERAGFRPLENYYSKAADAAAAAAPLAKIHQRALERGYRLRPIEMHRFEDEIGIIYRLSVAIFAKNFLYEEIALNDFLQLYEPARALIDPDFVCVAETPEGEPVGFVFSIVDYHEAVAAMRGQSGLLAKLKFFRRKRAAKAVNIKSLGVLPDYRHIGLAAALMCQSYQTALAKGFRRANLCLIREGNPSGRLDGDAGPVMRRYVLYQYQGDAA
jgi:GNAT superfamily N-acetyltransferase